MSSRQTSSAQAQRELQARRRHQRANAMELSICRWPERAVEAGVAAKLSRRPTYRDSRPGDGILTRALDWMCRAIGHAGVLSW